MQYLTVPDKELKPGYCVHGRQKNHCKECGGASVCEHGRIRNQCVECGGANICEHGRQRNNCKECGGASICEHGRQRNQCKECGGTGICEHSKRKDICKECGGAGICEHGRQRNSCIECGGTGICEHGRLKYYCKECGGTGICEHGQRKTRCKTCGGSSLCKSEWCEKNANNKYKGYCMTCFVHLFPNEPTARNYKTKEKEIVDRITKEFPDFSWINDRRIQDGCSKRRPDLLLDMGSHILIVEIDEYRHETYECSCENKRLMEISRDLQHRPVVFIRFNPDSYINHEGEKITSCWRINGYGLLAVAKTKRKEWEQRLSTLFNTIKHFIEFPTEKTIEMIELFY